MKTKSNDNVIDIQVCLFNVSCDLRQKKQQQKKQQQKKQKTKNKKNKKQKKPNKQKTMPPYLLSYKSFPFLFFLNRNTNTNISIALFADLV